MAPVQEFTAEIVEECDPEKRPGRGFREAGRKYDVDYQRFQYLIKKGKKIQELFDLFERVRLVRKMSKSALWDQLISYSVTPTQKKRKQKVE